MKTRVFFVVGILTILTNCLFAQTNLTAPQGFKPWMFLSYNQSSNQTFHMKKLSDGIYGTGAFNDIAGHSPVGSNASGFNGIIWFQNGNITNPLPVAGGISTIGPDGVFDITETDTKLWAIADGATGNRLYSCDKTSRSTWSPVTFTSDSMPHFIEAVDNTTLLIIGQMKKVNGITVNGICTYNTVTGVVSAVGTGFSSPYNRPTHITRSSNGKICISGRTGIAIYDTETKTFNELGGIGLGFFFGFIVHGDTMYTTGPDNQGSAIYRKIGTGGWQQLGYVSMGLGGTIVQVNNKIVFLTADNSDHVTYANGTVVNGSSFAWNEATNQFETAPVTGFTGVSDFLTLPSGEYLGWSAGGNLFATATLVSGVNEVSESAAIKIYPNPSQAGFVTLENLSIGTNIVITNSLGQTLLNEKATGNKFVFQTNDLAPGLYFVNKAKLIVQ